MSDANRGRASGDTADDALRRFHIALAWLLRVCGVSIVYIWLLMLTEFPRQQIRFSFWDSRNVNVFTAVMLLALSFMFAKAGHTRIILEVVSLILAIAVVAMSVVSLVVGSR